MHCKHFKILMRMKKEDAYLLFNVLIKSYLTLLLVLCSYDYSSSYSSIIKVDNKDSFLGPVTDPKVLIEGVLFRARYLGSTQLVCEGQPTKATRMMQAEEAVSRIKVGTKILFQLICFLILAWRRNKECTKRMTK